MRACPILRLEFYGESHDETIFSKHLSISSMRRLTFVFQVVAYGEFS